MWWEFGSATKGKNRSGWSSPPSPPEWAWVTTDHQLETNLPINTWTQIASATLTKGKLIFWVSHEIVDLLERKDTLIFLSHKMQQEEIPWLRAERNTRGIASFCTVYLQTSDTQAYVLSTRQRQVFATDFGGILETLEVEFQWTTGTESFKRHTIIVSLRWFWMNFKKTFLATLSPTVHFFSQPVMFFFPRKISPFFSQLFLSLAFSHPSHTNKHFLTAIHLGSFIFISFISSLSLVSQQIALIVNFFSFTDLGSFTV